MSRTISEIKEVIKAAVADKPVLSSLNMDSKVSPFGLIVYIISVGIWSLEKLMDIFRDEVDDHVARSRVHTLRWYRDRVLEFREGKDINWSDNVFSYPELLPSEELETLEIVKQAAVVEAPGELLIKIATMQGNELQPVSTEQEERVLAYMNEIKDAGNRIRIINLPPDELIIEGTIEYDPLVVSSDGSLVSDPSIKPIEVAANAYVNSENADNFNGEFRRTHFIDTLQKAQGIKDPIITSIKGRYGTLPFEEIPIKYIPNSGYHTITSMVFTYVPHNG